MDDPNQHNLIDRLHRRAKRIGRPANVTEARLILNIYQVINDLLVDSADRCAIETANNLLNQTLSQNLS